MGRDAALIRSGHETDLTSFNNNDTHEMYRNFGGRRNEENFLITRDGHRRLGRPKPVEIDDIEAIRKSSLASASD
jgi:Xaa-Pro aminopeptidase